MRILVAGLGSIGRRHLQNLRVLEPAAAITVWREHATSRSDKDGEGLADAVVYRLEDALASRPDAALIAGPASRHVENALAMVAAGADVFVEKPLSNTMDRVDELLAICAAHEAILMVGYNLRFCHLLRLMRSALLDGSIGRPLYLRAEVGQYLPDWRAGRDYRQTVSAQAALGGGAVLELSHEFDYVRWLAGEVETVVAQTGRLSDLDIDVEDVAEVILKSASGVIGSVHLDMVQRSPARSCRIAGTEGTLSLDWIDRRLKRYSAGRGTWEELSADDIPDRNRMYLDEMRHFLDCVRTRQTPAVTGEDGCEALKIALAAKESARTGQAIAV